MRKQAGFTLLELMMVVVIIGVLTAIALPLYNDYVTRGKLAEAFSNLADMRVRMEQYYQDNRQYDNNGACGANLASIASTQFFDYACVTDGQTYTITATGKAAEGVGNFVYTINESNARQTTTVGTGWAGAGNNCWVRNKDGSC
jgi:type IV pilus assembly protein PilE